MSKFKYKETEDYVENVVKYLKHQYTDLKPEWKGLLSMLASTYDTMLLAQEDIDARGIVVVTSKGVVASPAIKIKNDCQVRLEKIMSELTLSPKSQMKLGIITKSDGEDDFIDALMGKKDGNSEGH